MEDIRTAPPEVYKTSEPINWLARSAAINSMLVSGRVRFFFFPRLPSPPPGPPGPPPPYHVYGTFSALGFLPGVRSPRRPDLVGDAERPDLEKWSGIRRRFLGWKTAYSNGPKMGTTSWKSTWLTVPTYWLIWTLYRDLPFGICAVPSIFWPQGNWGENNPIKVITQLITGYWAPPWYIPDKWQFAPEKWWLQNDPFLLGMPGELLVV